MTLRAWWRIAAETGTKRSRRRAQSFSVNSIRTESLEIRLLLSGSDGKAAQAALDSGLFYWVNDTQVPLFNLPATSTFASTAAIVGPVMPTVFVTEDGGSRLWLTEQVYVSLDGVAPEDVFTEANGFTTFERVLGTPNQYVATVAAGAAASLSAANALHGRNGVEFAHPNFLMEVRLASSDPLYPSQWNLHNTGQTGGVDDADIDLPEAWEITRGSSDIVVAVLDVGVQLDHPDLVNNLFMNTGEIAGNGIDDDGNGWIDDVHGLDVSLDKSRTGVIEYDGDPSPGNAYDDHGTAVAGVIAAEADNGIGIAGVAPGVKIMPIRLGVSDSSGSFSITAAGMAAAVYYAAGRTADGSGTWRGADVANHSYGTSGEIPALTNALAWAATNGRGGRGLANFVSSGNGGGSSVSFPANLPTTIAVGATGQNDLRTSYSQYGTALDFVAPGGDGPDNGWIWTTDRTGSDGYASGDYVGINGTSFSSPTAAGIAALMLSMDPTLTFPQIRQIMRDTADRDKVDGVIFDSDGFNLQYGYGWLNARDAVIAAESYNAPQVDDEEPTVNYDDLVFQHSNGQWYVASSNGEQFTTSLWANNEGDGIAWVDQLTGDFNGDGLDDVAARNQQTGQWVVGLSTGTGFDCQVWGTWNVNKTWGQVLTGDFNGDGKTDIAGRIQNSGDGRWYISLSTGTGFQSSIWGTWTINRDWDQACVGDFNGDGRDDLAGRIMNEGDGRWFVSLSTPDNRLATNPWLAWPLTVNWGAPLVGDFNNDGLADIASRVQEAGDGRWYLALSNGSKFVTFQGSNFAPGLTLSHQLTGDFDGDGDTEIAGRFAASGRWFIWNLTDNKFAVSEWGTWSTANAWAHIAVGDFNGDGLTDLAGRDDTGNWQTAISTGTAFNTSLWGSADSAPWLTLASGAFA